MIFYQSAKQSKSSHPATYMSFRRLNMKVHLLYIKLCEILRGGIFFVSKQNKGVNDN